MALGAPATVMGQVLQRYAFTLARVAGVVLILFGLHVLRLVPIPARDS